MTLALERMTDWDLMVVDPDVDSVCFAKSCFTVDLWHLPKTTSPVGQHSCSGRYWRALASGFGLRAQRRDAMPEPGRGRFTVRTATFVTLADDGARHDIVPRNSRGRDSRSDQGDGRG